MKTFSSLYFWSANTDKLLKKVRPGDSLISYACDVTWLTHQAQGKVQKVTIIIPNFLRNERTLESLSKDVFTPRTSS